MQIQQSLIDVLLQLKSALHRAQSIAPLIALRFLERDKHVSEHVMHTLPSQFDRPVQICINKVHCVYQSSMSRLHILCYLYVLKDNASAPLVLEIHEFLGMLALLLTVLFKKLGKTSKSHIIPLEVVSLLKTKSMG